ncbi:MAG: alpha/beta hydrolase [Candidatus Eremiobacteraeota bacterium]|nr:alpha/beta hydrolase [Candidatus Eremiobacteraeota bacterium]
MFLHEGLGSVSLWKDVPARVAERTGCGIFVYSRRGYGASDALGAPREPDYMHREADVVLPALLDDGRIERPILFGHSDGASIALLFAAAFPGRARALVLEAPHVFVEDLSVASIAAAKTAFETTDLRSKLARHHADAAGAFRGWNDIWLDERFRAWNIEDRLALVDVPVLVVQGEDDEYGTLAQIRSIEAHVRDVTTVVLERCAHSPHRARPDAVLDAVAAFVARVEASERT